MKKTKLIGFALVVSVVLSGVGYASWADTLNITGTAQSGELNVEFIKDSEFFGILKYPSIGGAEVDQTSGYPKVGKPKYLTAPLTITQDASNAKAVAVNIQGMYPKTSVGYLVKFKNTGSIPAKLENIVVTGLPADIAALPIGQQMNVFGGFVLAKPNGFPRDAGIFNGKLKDFPGKINAMLAGKILLPNETISLDVPEELKDTLGAQEPEYNEIKNDINCIIFNLPGTATNDTQNAALNFDIKLNFKQ